MATPVRSDSANGTGNNTNQPQPASQNQQPQPSSTYDPIRSTLTSLSESETSDFDTRIFRDGYRRLSDEEKKSFRGALYMNPDLPGKPEEEILSEAAKMMKSLVTLQKVGAHLSKVTKEMLRSLDGQDSDHDFVRDLEAVKKGFDKLPESVRVRVSAVHAVFTPKLELYSEKEMAGDITARRKALKNLAKAHAMCCLTRNYFSVTTSEVREELLRMFRDIASRGISDGKVHATEGDIHDEYRNLSAAAKKALADVVGCAIGKPDSGEEYIQGKLKIDHEIIRSNPNIIVVVLRDFLALDGKTDLPSAYENLTFHG